MKEVRLTEGPILRSLVRFALPMMAGNLLQQVYNLVDTLVVGRCLGADALASVGSSYTLMTFITSIIIGLCMGSGALFSSDFGAGDAKQLSGDIRLSFVFIGIVTLVLYLIIYPGMGLIQQLLQVPEELMDLTVSYVAVVFAGIVFIFLYNFFAYILRSLGNSVTPLVFLAVSSVTNIILDILFVAVLPFGVAGAAWATVIAQAIAGIGITVYSLKKVPQLHLSKAASGSKEPFWDGSRMKFIIANDLMTGMQQSVMNFGILMIQGLVNSFGAVVMASFAAAVKIDTIAYMPAQEFGNAYSLFISQNFGAGQKDRIRKGTRTAMLSTFVFCLTISVLIFFLAGSLMKLFVGGSETEIIAEGVRYLRIEGALYIGIGILFLWYGYFRAIAKPHVSLILTIISLGTRVLLSYTLAPHTALGVTAIWCSIPIGWFLADIAGLCFFRKTGR